MTGNGGEPLPVSSGLGGGGCEVIENSKADAVESPDGGAIWPVTTGKRLGVRLYCDAPVAVMFRLNIGMMDVVIGGKDRTVDLGLVMMLEPSDHFSVRTVVSGL